ncbi:MAG: hypothetical protein QM503_07850 [Bacteroidota bacterium]
MISVIGINNAFSQQSKDSLYVLDAIIITSDSLLPLENAHAISKYNRWGTISNKQGRFKLYVQNSDSVLITSMGFSPMILQIDSVTLLSDSIVQILMAKDTLSINEVVIRAYWDYKTMKEIVISMQPIDLSQFYPDWTGTELLYLEPHPMSFKGPIQALYDAFNQSARLQRKLIKNRKEYNQIMYMMGRYLDTIPAKPEHMQELPD